MPKASSCFIMERAGNREVRPFSKRKESIMKDYFNQSGLSTRVFEPASQENGSVKPPDQEEGAISWIW